MNIDWAAIWAIVGPAVVGLGTWLKMRKPNQAKIDAAVAESLREASIADSEGNLYKRLREEIDFLRGDVNKLRAELDVERKHGRKMERHIWVMERMLRELGKEPPPFTLDDEPVPVPAN